MKTTIVILTNRKIIIPGLLILVLFSIFMFVEFQQTGYPVNIIRAQLTFSASELKSHFNELIQSGNLHRYWNYHLTDFIYIFVYASVLFLSAIGLSRQFAKTGRRIGIVIAGFFLVAATLDIAENIIMLRMLSEPQIFADWLAIAHSYFAAIKLVLFWAGIVWMGITFIYITIIKLK